MRDSWSCPNRSNSSRFFAVPRECQSLCWCSSWESNEFLLHDVSQSVSQPVGVLSFLGVVAGRHLVHAGEVVDRVKEWSGAQGNGAQGKGREGQGIWTAGGVVWCGAAWALGLRWWEWPGTVRLDPTRSDAARRVRPGHARSDRRVAGAAQVCAQVHRVGARAGRAPRRSAS